MLKICGAFFLLKKNKRAGTGHIFKVFAAPTQHHVRNYFDVGADTTQNFCRVSSHLKSITKDYRAIWRLSTWFAKNAASVIQITCLLKNGGCQQTIAKRNQKPKLASKLASKKATATPVVSPTPTSHSGSSSATLGPLGWLHLSLQKTESRLKKQKKR